MRIIIVSVLVCVSFFALSQKGLKNMSEMQYEKGRIVIKLKQGYSFADEQSRTGNQVNFNEKLDLKLSMKNPFRTQALARTERKSNLSLESYRLVSFDKNYPVEKAVELLSGMEGVEYAEALPIYQTQLTPDDPRVPDQNYLNVIKAFEAWDITQGSEDVVVAIIDSGVDYEHPDLDEKIFLNEDEIPDNGVDDDGDGFIDNYLGWDFIGGSFDNIQPDGDPMNKNTDSRGHGTWVAGLSAAETDNATGIAGLGFNARYMALKCGEEDVPGSRSLGFTTDAVIYAADNGADIINMSYGGPGFSQFAQDVMTYAAVERDAVLIAAAGNDGTDVVNYPAGYENVVSVAATDNLDFRASFSSYGRWVDMSAPGVQTLTTSPNENYAPVNGTSFSSPLVAGAAALLRAYYPDYNQRQISALLIASGDDINALNPNIEGQLGKRLNVERALTIQTPAFTLADISILDSEGDIPSAGENGILSFNVINELDPSSEAAYLKIGAVDENFIAPDVDSVGLGEVTGSVNIELQIPVNEDAEFNKLLRYEITITDENFDLLQSFFIELVVNPLVTDEAPAPYLLADGGDFESNQGDFRSAAIVGGINVWELGTPSNVLDSVRSGENVWKTDLDENVPYANFVSVLQSPLFDLSDSTTAYELSFFKSMETELDNAPYAVIVQYSLDGLTWEKLGYANDLKGTNWYRSGIFDLVEEDGVGFLGNYINEETKYNISEFAGEKTVAFRFVFKMVELTFTETGEPVLPRDGFMLDDFEVRKTPPTAEFTVNRTFAYEGQELEFSYISNGAESYLWDFGDGQTSDKRDPLHFYTEPGTYNVSLTITSNGNEVTEVKEELINVIPELENGISLSDGGDFETNQSFFTSVNESGTAFELGVSSLEGKDGTASGDFAWVTGIDSATYQDNTESYLYTPSFDFSIVGSYTLGFKAKYVFEDTWDGFIVEYSTDRGSTWTKLNEEIGDTWYNTISHPQAVFGPEVPIFSGSTEGAFEQYTTDVSFLSGNESVAFRFTFLTDVSTVDIGMALDDFEVIVPEEGPIVASFEANGVTGCEEQEITFRSTSTGSISTITWNFGENADPAIASGPGPHKVVYTGSGTSTVTMVAFSESESQEKTFEVTTAPLHTPTLEKDGYNPDGSTTLRASDGDDYRWYYENELIEDATEQTLTTIDLGLYSVEVGIAGCYQFAEEIIDVVAGIGLPSGFKMYPNPASNKIQLEFGRSGFVGDIKIYDLSGKNQPFDMVTSDSKSATLDISRLVKGSYILKLNDGSSVKFIKK